MHIHYKRAALISLLLVAWLLNGPALAAKELAEIEGAPFTFAAHSWLEAQVLPATHQASYKLATVMPAGITDLTVIGLTWPRSKVTGFLAVGTTGQQMGGPAAALASYLAFYSGENAPQALRSSAGGLGPITRIVVWPTSRDETADLVVLFSTVSSVQDAAVGGFAIAPGGMVREITMGRALTLYGWFEAKDINDDESYELITSRNLDGMWGGFFYHAVRTYDPVQAAYLPQPESCKEYFAGELLWLKWIIDTKPLIQAAPEKYLNQTGIGPAYIAEYNGVRYGFDSIIEVPETYTAVGDPSQFNAERRECFRLVKKYHDELVVWLAGGVYPETWMLAR